jgi:hypothetical protein
LLQVNTAGYFFGWVNEEMAVFSDREVALSPTRHIVELGSIGGGPAIGWFADGRDDGGDFRVQ